MGEMGEMGERVKGEGQGQQRNESVLCPPPPLFSTSSTPPHGSNPQTLKPSNPQTTLLSRAPITPRKLWKRVGNRAYLCTTIGSEFDQWQRRLAAVSAADAYFAQQIGLDAVEKLMDELETEIRPTLAAGETLKPRRSPGYGEMPLDLSREILNILDATKKIGVSLTDSLLLVPSKSVTAICEIG